MRRIVLLMGVLLAVSLSAQAGDLYRWIDEKGKVHYGDVPVPVADIEKKKFSDAAEPDAGQSYATRRAQQNFPVTLYVADNCAEFCKQARELLSRRGIPFAEKNLVTKEEIDAFKAASGSENIPALGVGKNFVNGFNSARWHNELDIAGYPKLVPWRPRTEPSPAAPPKGADSEAAPAGNAAP